ncbi:MAG: restriction endonuclease [Hyphomicrobiaceae bacterium]|nr:MAG: restriction endonuclease [Hyphomicrobiaceae bacterium]
MPTKSDLPSFESYFRPTVECVKARGGSMTIEEMEEAVAAAMELTDELRAIPHGEGPRSQFDYELAWVRTYLKKVGAMENSERGVWRLTPAGAAMNEAELAAIPRRVREMDRQRRQDREAEPEIEAVEDAIELNWKDKLLTALLGMAPDGFERLCQRILRESGFTKVEVTGRTGDGGIDGTGVLRVNLLSFHVLFQSKRIKGSVGAPVIRDFRGAMVGRADKGLIITTSSFTPEARREATRDGAPAIDLVDGDALCDLLKQLKLGVSIRLIEEAEVDPSYFNGI